MNVTPDSYSAAVEEPTNVSGVSWGAILAGAAGAAALSLILVLLGSGLGFSAMSPWANEGASAKTIGITAVIWLALTQILASGLGGYIAGRLRVKWSSLHGDEVYFRDTAHGFLSWAIATLVAAVLIVSSVSGVVSGGVKAGATAAAGVAGTAAAAAGTAASHTSNDQYGYFVDSLFRTDRPAAVSDDAAHGVVVRIFTKTLANDGQLATEDRNYLAQLVAQRTNLSQAEAQARVDQVYGQAKQAIADAKLKAQQAADAAAKAAAMTSLWAFVALLAGAFAASLAAIWGGRRRDAVTYLENRAYTTTTSNIR